MHYSALLNFLNNSRSLCPVKAIRYTKTCTFQKHIHSCTRPSFFHTWRRKFIKYFNDSGDRKNRPTFLHFSYIRRMKTRFSRIEGGLYTKCIYIRAYTLFVRFSGKIESHIASNFRGRAIFFHFFFFFFFFFINGSTTRTRPHFYSINEICRPRTRCTRSYRYMFFSNYHEPQREN